MRKTKIICTLGPATDDEQVLRNIMLAGMNVARFNFSHGTYDDHLMRLEKVRRLRDELQLPIATLLDTKGPEIRLGDFSDPEGVVIEPGDTFTLTVDECEGCRERAHVNYDGLPGDVKKGTRILINDGLISMTVCEVAGSDIRCTVIDGGRLTNHKGVNVPDVRLKMPYLSARDMADLQFGKENDFDFIAASFVRSATDVNILRNYCEAIGWKDVKIISKIENAEGVDNIDSIIEASDGIMVARGDMGVEISYEKIPAIQKMIIKKVYEAGKIVVTATQMLESMITNPRPTRAEITDVANAVYDGTSAVMLSGETAAGKYPVESLKTMAAIAERTERDINYFERMRAMDPDMRLGIGGATAHAACTTAKDTNASAIVTVTKSGATPRLISRFRPDAPIIACVLEEQVRRQLSLTWGVTPLMMDYVTSTDDMIEGSVAVAKEAGLLHDGEIAVVTAGVPAGIAGTTNMIKVHLVGNSLLSGAGVGDLNARGALCVCRTLEDVKSKFQPGMILVVPGTNNDMMPYLRQAAGVITEENGMGSHAAVVGLSLGLPVIVGAVGATRTLKDGMEVSMDCRNGSVQSLG